jgi:hypothetical protein
MPILIDLEDALPSLGTVTPTALNLGITGVAVISNGVLEPIASFSTPDVVNVMAHTDGQPASIAIGDIYGGGYQAVQFTIDVATSQVVSANGSFPISFITGATQSTAGAGLTTTVASAGSGRVTMTVTGNFAIGSNPANAIQADFNAFESLVTNPDGSISSRPTLFAAPTALVGKINGTVVNRYSGAPVVNATVVATDSNGNVVNTALTNASGNYHMHTIASGSYNLTVYNSYTNASGAAYTASGQQSRSSSVSGSSVYVSPGYSTSARTIND